MKVHLRKRQIKSKGSAKPRYTLYLDIYYSRRKRKREFLGLYLEPNDTKATRLNGDPFANIVWCMLPKERDRICQIIRH